MRIVVRLKASLSSKLLLETLKLLGMDVHVKVSCNIRKRERERDRLSLIYQFQILTARGEKASWSLVVLSVKLKPDGSFIRCFR